MYHVCLLRCAVLRVINNSIYYLLYNSIYYLLYIYNSTYYLLYIYNSMMPWYMYTTLLDNICQWIIYIQVTYNLNNYIYAVLSYTNLYLICIYMLCCSVMVLYYWKLYTAPLNYTLYYSIICCVTDHWITRCIIELYIMQPNYILYHSTCYVIELYIMS